LKIHVSISHDGDYVVAMTVLEKPWRGFVQLQW
jgi:phosphopantetheinyl transferase (holo-ACP synthase)